MPYKLVLIDTNDIKTELSPLAFDNPKSTFGFEDRKIEQKCKVLIKKLKKFNDVKDCYIEHY
jgi:hypothetical protein